MKAELVPNDGGLPIPITRDVTILGRREFCDVRIDDGSLSKRHAVIVRTDGLLVVRDLASTNGTKVNGQRVMWAALLPNDRLTLGRLKFKVYLGPDDVPGPSEAYRHPAAAATLPRPAVVRPAPSPKTPAAGFAPPTPIGVPIPANVPRLDVPGSTDPDSATDIGDLDDVVLDEDDEVFVIELE